MLFAGLSFTCFALISIGAYAKRATGQPYTPTHDIGPTVITSSQPSSSAISTYKVFLGAANQEETSVSIGYSHNKFKLQQAKPVLSKFTSVPESNENNLSERSASTPVNVHASKKTITPTQGPSLKPANIDTAVPSATSSSEALFDMPSSTPSTTSPVNPSQTPSSAPSLSPVYMPSPTPSFSPRMQPSSIPSESPSIRPSTPSVRPTISPKPSYTRTVKPSQSPTSPPSAEPTPVPSDTPTAVPTALPTTTALVTVRVHQLSDGAAIADSCDTSPTGLSSCNLRSAWALCLQYISSVSSSCSYPPSFRVVLPAGSTSILQQQHGGSLIFDNIAVTCNISLSIMSSSQYSQATIQGDSSSPGLMSVTSPYIRVISLHLAYLTITNFGTDSRFGSCVGLSDLALMTFTHVTMVSNAASENWLLRITNVNSALFDNFVLANNTCGSFSRRGLLAINLTDSVSFLGCAVRNNVGGLYSVHNNIVTIANVGNLMLSATTVSNNIADQGAVFWMQTIDQTVITGSHFYKNVGGFAGALYFNNVSDSVVTGSVFKYNRAVALGGLGGAVLLDGAKTESSVNFTNCDFNGNYAHNGGGAIAMKGVLSVFEKCSFEGNSGTRGGALYSDYTMDVDGCIFRLNTANVVKFDGDPAYFVPVGGAIFNDGGDNSSIAYSQFIKNTAAANGGAIKAAAVNNYSIIECSFNSNHAGGYGGGVSVESESSGISIEGTNLTSNTAQTHGGGLYFSPSNTFISIVYSVFLQNRAIEGSGGGVHFTGSCSKISIGGSSPQTLSIATANSSVIDSNYTALNYAGFVDKPNVAGYYVIFDVTTALNGDGYYNGIEISGSSGLVYQGRQFWEYQYKQNPSIYFYDDIATWPGIGGNSPLFVTGQRLTYKIHEEGDHYSFTAYPILKNQRPTTFSGNTAYLNGGAAYWGNANTEIFVMRGTMFKNNSVTSTDGSGGAIHMQISNGLFHIFSATFESNTAYIGGAMTVSQSNYPMSVYNCNFTDNYATGQGGAMYFGVGNGFGVVQVLTSSAIRILDSHFDRNSASLSGGGVFVSKVNALTFNNTLMTHNFANKSGGALHFEFQNICQMNRTTSIQNIAAGYGGAVQSNSGNKIVFDKETTFSKNYATYDGGAISMTQASIVTFLGKTDFLGNIAGEYGGAIQSSASFLTLGAAGILFEGNTASQGSAMRLESLTSKSLSIFSSNSTSITYKDNRCSGRGGTVSWTKDPSADAGTYSATDVINFNRIIYSNNSAIFGSNTSTQATSLQFAGNDTSLVFDYYSVLIPYPTVHLLDFFSAKDISDSSAVVTATVVSSSCQGHVGYISGITTATASAGNAVFTGLNAYCYPGGNMILKYTAQLAGLDASYNIDTQSSFTFRQCVDGEILVDNQCLECPLGSYSFHYDPLHPTTQCTDCPPFTDSCYGTTILALPGYWRISKYSIVLIECPYGKVACHGGGIGIPLPTVTSQSDVPQIVRFVSPVTSSAHGFGPTKAPTGPVDTSGDSPEGCALGYEGPLCAVCSEKYYFSSTSSTCVACAGQGQGQLAAMILIPLVILILVVYFTFTTFLAKAVTKDDLVDGMTGTKSMNAFISGDVMEMATFSYRAAVEQQKNKDEKENKEKQKDSDGWEDNKKSKSELMREWLSKTVIIMTPKLKIMLTVFQIVSSFPFALDIQFSQVSTKLFHAFSFVNFSALTLGSPQCYARYDYVDQLIVQTLAPICVMLLLLFSFIIHMISMRKEDKEIRSQIVTRYLTLFFFLTYLVLPSTSTTIFGAFTCRSIDPDNTVPGTPQYLRNDLSISCSSNRYHLGVYWAIVMIFVYPIGITSLYAYVLYVNREDIVSQNDMEATNIIAIETRVVSFKTDATGSEKATSTSTSTRGGLMQHITYKEIQFLHKAYEGRCWYWEVVETIRRLLLTAVLSVVTVGSSAQIVCGIFIAVVYIKLYGFFCPFKEDDDDVLQEMAQFQVFITLFISLLIRDDTFKGHNWNRALDVSLVVANLATSGAFIHSLFTARNYYIIKKDKIPIETISEGAHPVDDVYGEEEKVDQQRKVAESTI